MVEMPLNVEPLEIGAWSLLRLSRCIGRLYTVSANKNSSARTGLFDSVEGYLRIARGV